MTMIAKGVGRGGGRRKGWWRNKGKEEEHGFRIFIGFIIISQIQSKAVFVIYQVGTTLLPLPYAKVATRFVLIAK